MQGGGWERTPSSLLHLFAARVVGLARKRKQEEKEILSQGEEGRNRLRERGRKRDRERERSREAERETDGKREKQRERETIIDPCFLQLLLISKISTCCELTGSVTSSRDLFFFLPFPSVFIHCERERGKEAWKIREKKWEIKNGKMSDKSVGKREKERDRKRPIWNCK